MALAGVTADGKKLILIDTIDGGQTILFQSSSKITALTWTSHLLIGTIDGELIKLEVSKNFSRKVDERERISEVAIIFASENCVVDSRGCLFLQGKCVLDDGILQPSALIETEAFVFLLKWKNVYRLDKGKGSLKTWSLEESNSVFKHATFTDSLICLTDSSELFVLAGDELKRFSQTPDGTVSPFPLSDVEDENGSDDEAEEDNFALEREFLFGICSNHQRIATILGTPNGKAAWIELKNAEGDDNAQDCDKKESLQIIVDISCPLCPTADNRQNLSTTASSCIKGHPISICSESLTRIDSPNFYRCRRCSRCYKSRHDACKVCGFVLKSTNK